MLRIEIEKHIDENTEERNKFWSLESLNTLTYTDLLLKGKQYIIHLLYELRNKFIKTISVVEVLLHK